MEKLKRWVNRLTEIQLFDLFHILTEVKCDFWEFKDLLATRIMRIINREVNFKLKTRLWSRHGEICNLELLLRFMIDITRLDGARHVKTDNMILIGYMVKLNPKEELKKLRRDLVLFGFGQFLKRI